MEFIFFVLLVLIILVVTAKKTPFGEFNYQQKKRLFTPAERSFLGVLDAAIGSEYRVMGKVRVADVLSPQKGMSRKNWQTAFNRISAKHFDYVLCDLKTLEVKAAVELDDSSHNSKSRVKRDEFLDGACESAGLPLIRIKARRNYQVGEVKNSISATLNPQAPAEGKLTAEETRREVSKTATKAGW